jgi:hypothetical protein
MVNYKEIKVIYKVVDILLLDLWDIIKEAELTVNIKKIVTPPVKKNLIIGNKNIIGFSLIKRPHILTIVIPTPIFYFIKQINITYSTNRMPMDNINPRLSIKYPNTHKPPIIHIFNIIPTNIICFGNLFNAKI